MYNEIYSWVPGFKKADHTQVRHWNYGCECPLQIGDTNILFGNPHLWKHMEFFPHAKETLVNLSKYYQLIIVSLGTPDNIAYKAMWIKDNLPFIKDLVLISNKNVEMNKSIVNMKDGIFIDDHSSNLYSSNAERKYLFGNIFEWNEDWIENHVDYEYSRTTYLKNWKIAEEELISLYKKERQCNVCKQVFDDPSNLTEYTIQGRGFGSIFDSESYCVKICHKCITPEYQLWFWEKAQTIESDLGFQEEYQYEEQLWDFIIHCKQNNDNPAFQHFSSDPIVRKEISDFERYMYAED